MWRYFALALLVILVTGVLYFRYGAMPEPLAPQLDSARLLEPGPHEVAWLDHEFEDTSRPTQPNGEFPGADARTLKTRIWYPADRVPEERSDQAAEPMPLLLYSHGFMSQGELPFMMLAGDIDAIVPYHANARRMPERVPGALLVKLAVTAFFESQFAEDADVRRRHGRYLRDLMPRELPEVSVEWRR